MEEEGHLSCLDCGLRHHEIVAKTSHSPDNDDGIVAYGMRFDSFVIHLVLLDGVDLL